MKKRIIAFLLVFTITISSVGDIFPNRAWYASAENDEGSLEAAGADEEALRTAGTDQPEAAAEDPSAETTTEEAEENPTEDTETGSEADGTEAGTEAEEETKTGPETAENEAENATEDEPEGKTEPDDTEDQAAARAKVADQYGFTDTRYALFYRQRILTAAEYRALIGTYSDHITIEESIRERFFNAIEETINRHGGSITRFDTIDLQLARKP